MGNFIFATVLLCIVIIFTGVNSFIICSICEDIIDLIDAGQQEDARAMWEEKRGYIAVFVRDAEIDVVDSESAALGDTVESEDGEAAAAKMKFREAVMEIVDSEKPSFQDIFVIDIKRGILYNYKDS